MLKTFAAFSSYLVVAYRNRLIFFELTRDTKDLFVDQFKLPDNVISMEYKLTRGQELFVTTERNEIFIVDELRKVVKTRFCLSSLETILV
jgi:hypothetical protein